MSTAKVWSSYRRSFGKLLEKVGQYECNMLDKKFIKYAKNHTRINFEILYEKRDEKRGGKFSLGITKHRCQGYQLLKEQYLKKVSSAAASMKKILHNVCIKTCW